MTTTTNKSVAIEIHKQIGQGALFMIGAKNFVCDDRMLAFKIGKNANGVNYIRIKLNGMDTYDVDFLRIRAGEMKTISEERGIYNDMLRGSIERNTGLYTSI